MHLILTLLLLFFLAFTVENAKADFQDLDIVTGVVGITMVGDECGPR